MRPDTITICSAPQVQNSTQSLRWHIGLSCNVTRLSKQKASTTGWLVRRHLRHATANHTQPNTASSHPIGFKMQHQTAVE